MYCKYCGTTVPANARFCPVCGKAAKAEGVSAEPGGHVGYSDRIGDPAFAKYIKNSNRWAAIFSVILAVAAVIGFFIAGEMNVGDMENPQSLYIGLGIGGMFILIALFQILGRKRSRTWDGVVMDKTVKKKSRQRSSGSNDYYTQHYTEYTVAIREDGGKVHLLTAEDDDTVYRYYRVGDRARHHGGLNSFEKYDKSQDTIIFCNACGTLCDIGEDICPRCKCPLLK